MMVMNRRLAMAAVLAPMVVAGSASASLLSENWSGYSNGATPGAPWSVSQVSTADESVTVSNGRLHYVDNGFNDTALGYDNGSKQNWNPEVKANFSSASSAISNITFSYMIDTDKSGAQPQISFRDNSGNTAITIGLGKNWQRTGIYYVNSNNETVSVGHTFSLGETVTITLTNIDFTAKTYTLNWSTDKVSAAITSGQVNATFTKTTVTNLASVFISNNTGGDGKADFYLGAITVDAVPEPASLGLLGLVGAALLIGKKK